MLQMNKAIDKQFRKQISFDLHFILIFYDQQTQKYKDLLKINVHCKPLYKILIGKNIHIHKL